MCNEQELQASQPQVEVLLQLQIRQMSNISRIS